MKAVVQSLVLAAMLAVGQSGRSDDLIVNGYSYAAPSVYLVPPPVVYQPYQPTYVVPMRQVVQPMGYYAPAPVVYVEPAFVTQTVVPYNPPVVYAPQPVMVGPSAVVTRAHVGRYGVDYRYREFVPGRAAPVYSYKVDTTPRGVVIRERVR